MSPDLDRDRGYSSGGARWSGDYRGPWDRDLDRDRWNMDRGRDWDRDRWNMNRRDLDMGYGRDSGYSDRDRWESGRMSQGSYDDYDRGRWSASDRDRDWDRSRRGSDYDYDRDRGGWNEEWDRGRNRW